MLTLEAAAARARSGYYVNSGTEPGLWTACCGGRCQGRTVPLRPMTGSPGHRTLTCQSATSHPVEISRAEASIPLPVNDPSLVLVEAWKPSCSLASAGTILLSGP